MFLTPEALDAQLDALVIDMEHDADYHNLDVDEYEEKYLWEWPSWVAKRSRIHLEAGESSVTTLKVNKWLNNSRQQPETTNRPV